MTDALTPTQALAIWALLARQGLAKAADLKPKPKAADLKTLIDKKLVAPESVGRAKGIRLTEKGWTWANDHVRAELPPSQRLLQDFLARIADHNERHGTTLADLIEEAPPAPPPRKRPNATELRKLIGEAYLRATGGVRSEPVRLTRLRAELGALDRKTVDAGLARIVKAKKETARLSQISDNKAIDAAEREAAFSPAGEPFHLIRIQ